MGPNTNSYVLIDVCTARNTFEGTGCPNHFGQSRSDGTFVSCSWTSCQDGKVCNGLGPISDPADLADLVSYPAGFGSGEEFNAPLYATATIAAAALAGQARILQSKYTNETLVRGMLRDRHLDPAEVREIMTALELLMVRSGGTCISAETVTERCNDWKASLSGAELQFYFGFDSKLGKSRINHEDAMVASAAMVLLEQDPEATVTIVTDDKGFIDAGWGLRASFPGLSIVSVKDYNTAALRAA